MVSLTQETSDKHSTSLCLIVAMSRNSVIGVENRLPWNIPEDLKRFREITTGHPIIMGRKTFESIGRALPKRTNIVITRDASALQGRVPETVAVVNSLEQAVERARGAEIPGREEVFVIGGGEIYRQAISQVDRLYITQIDEEYAGDAFFPEFKSEDFREISRERHEARESEVSPHHGGHDAGDSVHKTSVTIPAFEFIVLERR